jgi:hypothetical protein
MRLGNVPTVFVTALVAAGCFGTLDVGSEYPPGTFKRQIPREPDAGDGCTLAFVGGGPLEALTSGTNSLSKPAITAVNDGFVLAYASYDEKVHITTLKVADNGGWVPADDFTKLPFNRYSIPGACPDDADIGGIGLRIDAPAGLVAIGRSPRCSQSALSVFPALDSGHFAQAPAISSPFSSGATTQRWSLHPLSWGGYFVTTVNSQTQLQTLSSAGLSVGDAQMLGGKPPHRQAFVAASTKALAVLTEAGLEDADSVEMRLQMAGLAGSSRAFGEPVVLQGRFSSLAIEGSRAVVVSSAKERTVASIHRINLGDSSFQSEDAPSADLGDVVGVDVSVSDDRMYVAQVHPTGIAVLAYDGYAGAIKPLRTTTLTSRTNPLLIGRIESFTSGSVAVAAKHDRVGLVWTTGTRVQAGEAVGGWAVLSCR